MRNAASFGAFLAGPLFMALLSRALGPAGYGRWWWTFGILEGAGILGMLASDLWVRREIPRAIQERGSLAGAVDPVVDAVAAGLTIAVSTGLVAAVLLVQLARPLAAAQGDPELAPYLLVLALQPLLWNVTNLFAAALQSIDVLGPVALARGVLLPLIQLGGLLLAWQARLAAPLALALLLSANIVTLIVVAGIYTSHLPLGATLARALRPRRFADALRYGLLLLLPSVLWTLGGKLDLYVLRAHVGPEQVGVYAACLHTAAILPSLRALFDPIAQTQVAALSAVDGGRPLAASLQRMTRLCIFVLLPPFVLLCAVGEIALGILLGRPATGAALPLAILCTGQLLGSLAIGSWLVPMTLPGRLLVAVAGTTLVAKAALLFALVPAHPLLGAAIATAAGTIISLQGQSIVAGWRLRLQLMPAGLSALLLTGALGAGAGWLVFERLSHAHPALAAIGAATAALLPLLALAPWLLAPDERAALRAMFRRSSAESARF